jgi:hypothetical protein
LVVLVCWWHVQNMAKQLEELWISPRQHPIHYGIRQTAIFPFWIMMYTETRWLFGHAIHSNHTCTHAHAHTQISIWMQGHYNLVNKHRSSFRGFFTLCWHYRQPHCQCVDQTNSQDSRFPAKKSPYLPLTHQGLAIQSPGKYNTPVSVGQCTWTNQRFIWDQCQTAPMAYPSLTSGEESSG